MDLHLNRCLWCGLALPARQPGRAGRNRLYCRDTHRKRAHAELRRRQCEPAPGPIVDPGPLPPPARADELLAVTILETKGNAAALARLSLTARREFAWRAEIVATTIQHALDDYFPGV